MDDLSTTANADTVAAAVANIHSEHLDVERDLIRSYSNTEPVANAKGETRLFYKSLCERLCIWLMGYTG